MSEQPQRLPMETVEAMVAKAHGDLDAVRELLDSEPSLANAAWDWGGGDWESALGAAAHMGRRDIAEPLLEGDTTAEVCIVGGGFTGLWTALTLREREPSAHVVIVEADRCGSGPSGRNGGFLHGYWATLASNRVTLGDEDALAIARAGD